MEVSKKKMAHLSVFVGMVCSDLRYHINNAHVYTNRGRQLYKEGNRTNGFTI